MIQRRWAIHIIRDILNEVTLLSGLGRSQIRQIAGMNFYQTEEYIGFLLGRDFIASTAESNGEPIYEVTPRGQHLLTEINELLVFMDVDTLEELPLGNSRSKSGREAVAAA